MYPILSSPMMANTSGFKRDIPTLLLLLNAKDLSPSPLEARFIDSFRCVEITGKKDQTGRELIYLQPVIKTKVFLSFYIVRPFSVPIKSPKIDESDHKGSRLSAEVIIYFFSARRNTEHKPLLQTTLRN